MADEKSLAELFTPPGTWFAEGRRPVQIMVTVQRVYMVCGCAVLLVDQKLYVVQWSCEISAAHCERRAGEDGSPRRPN